MRRKVEAYNGHFVGYDEYPGSELSVWFIDAIVYQGEPSAGYGWRFSTHVPATSRAADIKRALDYAKQIVDKKIMQLDLSALPVEKLF